MKARKAKGKNMLQLNLLDGRIVQRVSHGFMYTKGDIPKIIREFERGVKENKSGEPMLWELWEDVTPKVKTNNKIA